MACKVCQKTFVLSTDDEYDSDTKPHVCSTCGQSFSLKIQLKRHTLLHANGEPFTCINCSKDSEKDEDDSKSYNLRLTKKGDYACEICSMSFTSKRLLLRHTNEEHAFEESYFCDDCPEFFDTSSDLKKHSLTHKIKSVSKKRSIKAKSNHGNNSKSLTCPSCKKSFAYQACLDKHVKKCMSEDNSKSSKKRGTNDVSKKSKMDYVEVYENTDKKHECSICGKSFTRKSALDGHQAIHLQEESDSFNEDASGNEDDDDISEAGAPKINIKKSYICIKCNFVCFSRLTLVKHVCRQKNQEDAEDKEKDTSGAKRKDKDGKGKENNTDYDCPKCEKSFDSADELKEHKLTHSKNIDDKTKSKIKREETFDCDICDKVFRSEKRLKRHLESHVTDDCDIDEIHERFSKKKHKSKNYTCDICGKRFAGETCLKKHARRHEEQEESEAPKSRRKKQKVIENLTCSFCNEEFIGRKNAYLKHMHIHTPEVCGICDERFVDRQSLREHCKVHVGTEEGRMFMECSQKALDAKNGLLPPEPKVEYIYLVLR